MKRLALTVALISVALLALMAVFALAGGEIGDTGWKVISSSLLVMAGTIVALASAVPLQQRRLGLLPYAGVGASIIGFGMLIVGLWADTGWSAALKTALTLVTAAAAVGAIGLLDGARVPPRQRRIVAAAQAATGIAATLLIAALWGEVGNEAFWRITGIVLVLTAAGMVTVPVLHRMAAIPAGGAENGPRVSTCPLCGEAAPGPLAAAITCEGCGRTFRVSIL